MNLRERLYETSIEFQFQFELLTYEMFKSAKQGKRHCTLEIPFKYKECKDWLIDNGLNITGVTIKSDDSTALVSVTWEDISDYDYRHGLYK